MAPSTSHTSSRGGVGRRLGCLTAVLALLGACSGSPKVDPYAKQPSQPPTRTKASVPLGTTQKILASSSFGPGTADVPIDVTVYGFRDHVAPAAGIRPKTPATHWASADIKVCRSKPIVFGYIAWVLEDAVGRPAQESAVAHKEFPQPPFPDSSTRAGCARGWVTWVTPDNVKGAKVSFEQAREFPGPWRVR